MNQLHQLLSGTTLTISYGIAVGLLLIGCGNYNSAQSSEIEIREENTSDRDIFGIFQQIIELGKDFSTFEDNSAQKKQVTPISFQELIEYLPQSPRGWTTEKLQGQTSSLAGYSVSQVKQSYLQKDKTMTVSIFDWTFNPALYLPFLLSTEFSQESIDGYNKGVEIDNIPGREAYNYHTKDGSLNLLIDRRFFVQIKGDNIEERELREWWKKIDSDSLSQVNN
ncbi:hypothetical protein I4641_01175 [Waterburya agarophytonicola K14]|uniref:Uncharacterized protein n=1 Tax=Waterburya agarophytonicola KI4 TaxID=2874699 RepID=A0A964BNU9_9CYAN|nr:hypothetical protein [Waterburya agarophytonicola KI4]